jgi:hypothetical protein
LLGFTVLLPIQKSAATNCVAAYSKIGSENYAAAYSKIGSENYATADS